jgi:hypothetical protein
VLEPVLEPVVDPVLPVLPEEVEPVLAPVGLLAVGVWVGTEAEAHALSYATRLVLV